MILLVEDQEALRTAVSLSLEKHGFAVISACDGTSAVATFRERINEIDMVLLDVTLPGLSGAEVYRELLRMKPELKILLTSAYDVPQISPDFLLGGKALFHFIRKPYRISDLLRVLQQICLQGAGNPESC